MDKPTKILFGGVVCAVLIAATGYANTYRLESKLHRLELECVEEDKRDKSELGHLGTLVCDVKSLINVENGTEPLIGIQAQIAQTQNDVLSSKEWPYLLAILALLLSVVPWTWYFLLRRIREVRDAIVGK